MAKFGLLERTSSREFPVGRAACSVWLVVSMQVVASMAGWLRVDWVGAMVEGFVSWSLVARMSWLCRLVLADRSAVLTD